MLKVITEWKGGVFEEKDVFSLISSLQNVSVVDWFENKWVLNQNTSKNPTPCLGTY